MTTSIVEAPGPGLPAELEPGARALAETVIAGTGEHLSAILLYGSQLLRAEPDRHSAWDLVLVVERYRPFHRALVRAGLHRGPAWLLDLMGHLLPPSVTALQASGSDAIGKCVIASREHLRRGLLPGAPDHFLKGRLVQKVALIWARDAATASEIEGWVRRARREVLTWISSQIAEPFDAASVSLRTHSGSALSTAQPPLLHPIQGARYPPLVQIRADLRRVASLPPQEGRAPHRRGDRTDAARGAPAPDLPLAESARIPP